MDNKENNKFIVFLDLPLHVRDKVDQVRIKYAKKHVYEWPSHITIKYDEVYTIPENRIIEIFNTFFKTIPVQHLILDAPRIDFMKDYDGWNISLPTENNESLRL